MLSQRKSAAGRRLRCTTAAVLLAAGLVTSAAFGAPAQADPNDPNPAAVPQGGGRPRPPGPDRCSTPSNDVVREVPWTQRRLAPERAWELTRGAGVIVGVVDTGVDAAVPQLKGKVLPGVDIVNGSGRADNDCYGHGTFVAGLIAADPQPWTGVAGIAPGVKILPIRQANDTNDGSADGLARSIVAAVNAGARVVNISASSFFPSRQLEAAVRYATARDVLLVAAASNEAQQGNPTAYPAAYPEVVAVGAVDSDGKRSQFSEVGDFLDLVAPGTDVVSLSRAGRGHVMDSGTSYATPFVTAVAALVRARYPHLSAAQVKRRLELTADHPSRPMPDREVGWGVVNPYQALAAVLPDEAGPSPVAAEAAPIPPIRQPRPDTRAADTSTAYAAVGALGAGGVALLGYLVPLAVRRRWQAADRGSTGGDA